MNSELDNFKVVAIGASAGGLESIETIFQNINSHPGMAFVVIQHLSPDFKSFMPEILNRKSKMNVETVESKTKILPNSIYLLPPKKNMRVDGDYLYLEETDKNQIPNKPINLFFKSLAEQYKSRAIAVILSGTGSDGTEGTEEIKKHGGFVYVESPETAKFDGMPRSAIENGKVDSVGSPREIALNICGRKLKKISVQEKPRQEIVSLLGETKATIFFLVQERYGVDFSKYKLNTVYRRLEKRMSAMGFSSEEKYLSYLKENSSEVSLLYHEMLIGVTKFFRDNEGFTVIKDNVIPSMIEEADEGTELRIWTAGCASGEEPYSLAILLAEQIAMSKKELSYKIFATDIDDRVLTIAAEGIYNNSEFEDMPKDLIERYFERITPDQLRIIPSIRKRMVFARHNILNDPPFMNMDLVTCRNLLIYFAEEAQEKAVSMILFALKMGAYLYLGPSEALGKYKNCFSDVSRTWKIFKKEDHEQISLEISQNLQATAKTSKPVLLKSSVYYGHGADQQRKNQTNKALNLLLQNYVPPSILVTENLDILHTFGSMGDFFRLKPGIANLNIRNMADERLASSVGVAVQRASKEGKKITYKSFGSKYGEEDAQGVFLKITAVPLSASAIANAEDGPLLFLLSLEEGTVESQESESPETLPELSAKDIDHIALLESELETTKESLQGTIEELETTNEELQSTNEELLASNEELQSTNEELHSVNEELYTVNSEYQSKIEELTSLSHDEENLLKSTGIGTIFLDNGLRIRKFTPAVSENFNILKNDIGRPLDHITNKILIDNLSGKIRSVIETKKPAEYEASAVSGKSYRIRIYPYETEFDPADGVVITFIDITKNKRTEQALQKSNEELEEFAYITSHDLKTPLRHISHHVEILKDALGSSINTEAKECIDTVTMSAHKMNNMIEGIFKLSKIGKTKIEFERVDLTQMVRETCSMLSESIEETNGEVLFNGLHKVDCESDMIAQVLQNLIQNSLKYRKPNVPPKVKIESKETSSGWFVSVEDNGRGIKEDQHDRIFKLFQRINTDDRVEGLGIGLALCKKIIEMHGGDFFVDSKYGVGTKITFSLPNRHLKVSGGTHS